MDKIGRFKITVLLVDLWKLCWGILIPPLSYIWIVKLKCHVDSIMREVCSFWLDWILMGDVTNGGLRIETPHLDTIAQGCNSTDSCSSSDPVKINICANKCKAASVADWDTSAAAASQSQPRDISALSTFSQQHFTLPQLALSNANLIPAPCGSKRGHVR